MRPPEPPPRRISPEAAPGSLAGDVAWLALAQVVLALVISVPALAVIGGCAAWVPALGTLAAAWAFALRRERARPGWLTRLQVRRLAVGSGLVHAILASLGVAIAWAVAALLPGAAALPAEAAWLAPVLGLGVGLVALVLTLCAGDAAAATLGVWQDPEPEDRRPPLPRRRR